MTELPKTAFDREGDGDIITRDKPTPRPRDAATLVLVRRDASEPRVLMGKRSGRHDFMPDKYVFPGGRSDPQDGRVPAFSELSPANEARLRQQSRRLPRALALTAIRETFEETGLLVGRSAEMPAQSPPGWQTLFDLDIAPSLQDLHFIGRAITPPYRPKRFDARFFMADAETVLIDDRPPIDGAELHDLQWVSLSDTKDLDLPMITQFMISEIADRLSSEDDPGPPFLRWSRSGHINERICAV
ncbi:MAG: NUDIX hydrolase [Pseudomonadota bacterium]